MGISPHRLEYGAIREMHDNNIELDNLPSGEQFGPHRDESASIGLSQFFPNVALK